MDMLTLYMIAESAGGFKQMMNASKPMQPHACLQRARHLRHYIDLKDIRTRDGRKILVSCGPAQKRLVIAKEPHRLGDELLKAPSIEYLPDGMDALGMPRQRYSPAR